MKKIILLFTMISIISCSDDFVESNFIGSEITNETEAITGLELEAIIGVAPSTITMAAPELMMMSPSPIEPANENIFVALVNEGSCGATSRYLYSIYASSTDIYDYDREVQAAVVKDGIFVEAKILTIPAGQNISNNVNAFVGASSSHGNVISKAYNVLVDDEIIDGYHFPSISYNVSNCFTGVWEDGCVEGIYSADNPNTVANEGPGDEDGDGICNHYDYDDNGNDIADVFEDVLED